MGMLFLKRGSSHLALMVDQWDSAYEISATSGFTWSYSVGGVVTVTYNGSATSCGYAFGMKEIS